MKEFSKAAAPGTFLADLIPPLAEVIPVSLQWWRPRALRYQKRQTETWMKYWNALQHQLKEGRAPQCFVKQFSESGYKSQSISDVQAAYVAGSKSLNFHMSLVNHEIELSTVLAMIEAGSETTSAALNSVIKFLAAYPDVQRKAREEIFSVVGNDRTPTYSDNLPYIRAIGKEIMRMRPVTNIGTPHRTSDNVIYKDMFIPKGTVISIHQYALHYDESRYKDPETFNPDRYLGHSLKAGVYAAHPDPYERDHFNFGAGRRICPGMHLAENSLGIVLAKLLWAFEILPPKGMKMDLSDEANEEGSNTLPKPYRVRFVPRSEEVAEVIRREWSVAQKNGFWLGTTKVNTAGVVFDN